jgi:hypothetical protein
MCDEYEHERMRIFWRQLALQAERSDLETEPETVGEPLVKPAEDIVVPANRRSRTLVH